jgi:hypothetical protein
MLSVAPGSARLAAHALAARAGSGRATGGGSRVHPGLEGPDRAARGSGHERGTGDHTAPWLSEQAPISGVPAGSIRSRRGFPRAYMTGLTAGSIDTRTQTQPQRQPERSRREPWRAVSPTAPAATTTTSGTRSFPPGRATSAASSTSTCGRWQPTGGFAETRLVRRTWLPIRVHRRIVGSGYGPGGAQRPAPHGNGAAALVPAPRSAGGNSAPVLDPVCVTVRAFILLDDMNRQSAMPSHFEALLLRPGTDLAAAFATSY